MIKYLLLLTSLGSVASTVSTTRLQVQIPRELAKPGEGYGHEAANFGVYPYGAFLQQPVFYSKSKFCSDADPLTVYYPTPSEDSTNNSKQPRDGHYHTPFILMVDRGDCLFTTKVRHAQRAGAAAVLIADDRCVCSHDVCTGGDTRGCEAASPLIMDDGSGGDISIPSFLLYKEDADAMKQVLLRNENVIVSMGFQIPAPDARVEYELWTSPTDHLNLWSSLRTIALALGDRAKFTPHMSFYDGTQQGCTYDGTCATMCTNRGRYCAFDPDNSFEEGVSGADLVAESLRRICIWNRYGQDDGIGKEWFDYMHTFSSTCYKDGSLDRFVNEDCVRKAMKKSGIDPDTIDACMRDSGGLQDDGPNTLLDQALATQRDSGTVLIPSVWVNRVPVRGSMSFVEIVSAICSGFVEGSQPELCRACQACPHNAEQCIRDGGVCDAQNKGSIGITYSLFGGSLGGLVILFFGVGFVYQQQEKRHMRDQVRNIMAEYSALPDGDKEEATNDRTIV